MKIFALLTVFALLGGSQAFLKEVADLFHNLGTELGAVGKDLLHVAEPVANSLLQTLEKAGTQLLTTAASDLLTHLGGAAGKRDLGEVVDKIGKFVTNAEQYLKDTGSTLETVYKHTLEAIQQEIDHVVNDVKPVSGLIDEVKKIVEGHNNFLDVLGERVLGEGVDLFNEIIHHGESKRGLAETAHTFGQGLQNLIQQVAAPLKTALSGIVTDLESKVLSLLG
ncbi:uncharacterized protein LOC135479626 [Liolophura sinensis]|uniref:uncharacterized protein LOC135479626 n=1 Tax=Liolophura sinensis TaxID=3198878 RepID=UPI0031580C88